MPSFKNITNGVLFFGQQLFISLDQLANVLLWGYADETLSARSYRMHRDNRIFGKLFMPIINLLFIWQNQPNKEGHCYNAYLKEINRNTLPPEYRKFIKE